MKTKIDVGQVVGGRRIYFNIMSRRGGVSFSLTVTQAVKLADKLNALLDDPSGGDDNARPITRRRK